MRDNRDTLKLCYEAIREDGASVDQCVERFHAVAVVEQLRALPALAALEKSMPSSSDQANREKRFSEFVSNPPRRRGIFNLLFGTPRRGAAVGVIALLAITGGATATANLIGGSERPGIIEDPGLAEANGCGPAAVADLEEDELILCEWGLARVAEPHDTDSIDRPINTSPTAFARLSGVKALTSVGSAAYGTELVAIMNDGTVRQFPQAGEIERPDFYQQAPLETLTDVKEIDGSLFLKEDGSVWTWSNGGNPEIGELREPRRYEGLTDIVDISGHLALRSDGVVMSRYSPHASCSSGTLPDPPPSSGVTAVPGLPPVQAVSAGGGFALALAEDGSIWAWGYNNAGQLGNGERRDEYIVEPVQVDLGVAGQGVRATSISAGSCYSLAGLSDGSIVAWGYGEETGAMIGDGPAGTDDEFGKYRPTPVLVNTGAIPEGVGVISVHAGSYNSAALLSNGTLLRWGYDSEGELGNGQPLEQSAIPLIVPQLVGVRLVAGIAPVVAIGRCDKPECDPNAADIEMNNAVVSPDVLPFADGTFESNIECAGEAAGPAPAAQEQLEGSELFFKIDGVVVGHAGTVPLELTTVSLEGLTCGGFVHAVLVSSGAVPGAGNSASFRRFYFAGEKPFLPLEGAEVVLSAVPDTAPVLRAQPAELGHRSGMLLGLANYSIDGEFQGWESESCRMRMVERPATAESYGIAWESTGVDCSNVFLFDLILRSYSVYSNAEDSRTESP